MSAWIEFSLMLLTDVEGHELFMDIQIAGNAALRISRTCDAMVSRAVV